MRIRFHQSHWRAAIALLLAYALCVQTSLGLEIATHALADAPLADAFVICSDHAGSQPDDGSTRPAKSAHCAFCTLVPLSSALSPDRDVFVFRIPVRSTALPLVLQTAGPGFQQTPHFLSRAPPAIA